MSTYEGKLVKDRAGLLREGMGCLITRLRKFELHLTGSRKPWKAFEQYIEISRQTDNYRKVCGKEIPEPQDQL